MTDKDIKRKNTGILGENIACEMLEGRGMTILERNWRAGHKEIDIICRDGADLRFVEVKSRKEPLQGQAWEAVDKTKQHTLGEAAKAYINSPKMKALGFYPNEYHFDIVTVVWNENGDEYSTQYIPDAYILIYA